MMKLKAFLTVLCVMFSTFAAAQSVKVEMLQMKSHLDKLITAKTSEDFQVAAEQFIRISENAKANLPDKVGKNPEASQDYQAGIQQVIDTVKQADELAKAGKLQEAKIALSQLEMLKREYHKKYK